MGDRTNDATFEPKLTHCIKPSHAWSCNVWMKLSLNFSPNIFRQNIYTSVDVSHFPSYQNSMHDDFDRWTTNFCDFFHSFSSKFWLWLGRNKWPIFIELSNYKKEFEAFEPYYLSLAPSQHNARTVCIPDSPKNENFASIPRKLSFIFTFPDLQHFVRYIVFLAIWLATNIVLNRCRPIRAVKFSAKCIRCFTHTFTI